MLQNDLMFAFRIEKDVFNLRNRVRLLELEHKRAIKKITEASERAQHMADLKAKNDQKYMEVFTNIITNLTHML